MTISFDLDTPLISMRLSLPALSLLLGWALHSSPVLAQQFTNLPGAIPGTARWSEGVEAADVDQDGDLDLFFADGDGFTTPGPKRQNVLIINRFEVAPNTFADESLARLGAHASNAKMVITGDLTGDGWTEAFFCNAFGTDAPFLYVNQGATDPGQFDFEGAARGFTSAYSSGSGQFGDVDDDGDLDILLADAYLGGPAGKPHLFLNDGLGFFSEDAAFSAAAPIKSSQMDVQLVDLDADWDLDFLGACRAENGSSAAGDHYVLLNGGDGTWSDASEVLLDGQSSSVYEIEVGDLDGDGDLDLFFVSLSSFRDGPVRNDLVPSGSLAFAAGSALGGDDDNEIALFDFDVDGDLDAFVGSLGPREKIIRNNGGFNFTQITNQIQSINDSTLDMTVADLDNDGAYDLITAQGESNSSQWANKIYRNTGPADTLPPVVLATEPIGPRRSNGEWVVHARVQDQVVDDGKTWVKGEVRWVASANASTGFVSITSGGFQPPMLNISSGAGVIWTNNDTVQHSVTGTTPGYIFDSGPIAPGASYRVTFIVAGSYGMSDTVGAAGSATVGVAGTHQSRASLAVGPLHRFAMQDGTGVAKSLSYELAFTDGAGNTTITPASSVILASAKNRSASPNPDSYSVVTPPVLGGVFSASVDLGGTTGHALAFLVGFDGSVTLTLGGGQVLLALDLFGSGELLGLASQAGPVAAFGVAVPNDLSLLGFGLFTQAIHLGGVTPFALSNANDLVVGY